MKKFIFLIISLGYFRAQNPVFCVVVPDSNSNNSSAVNSSCGLPNSFIFHKKYKQATTYIPKPGSRTKIINMNFNVFQDANGNFNFPSSDTASMTKLNQILSWVKWFYGSNSQPTDPVSCLTVNDLNSKYIDFNISGVYFYMDNTTFYTGCSISTFINYINAIDTNRLKQMNYFASYGSYNGASGCVNYIPSITDLGSYTGLNSGAVTFSMDLAPWVRAQNMAHEIGHVLGLYHTYDISLCNTSYFDYLYDVHGPASCSFCPHFGPFADPSTSPNDGITNNLMGGSIDNSYASPKQIGMMHRSLYLLSPGKYTRCTYDPNNPFEVDTVEWWDFRFRGFEDLKIKSTGDMTLGCTYYLTDSAMIHIMPGGKMYVSPTGTILNRCGCHGNAFKIEGLMNFATSCSPPANTTIQILPTGTLSTNHFCFQNGVKFQISPGGKLYINNQDYTNEIQNYTQLNVTLSNQTVSQNVYAMQNIYALSNVQTSGSLKFKAGNKIVLQDDFKGTNGFTATVDPNVSYCNQSSCVESYNERMNFYSNASNQTQQGNNSQPNQVHSLNLKEKVLQLPEALLVYPNTTSGPVALSINKEKILMKEITVRDFTGKTVMKFGQSNAEWTHGLINLSELENGIYVLSVQTSSGKIHHAKIILCK